MPGAETFQASAEAYDSFVGRYGSALASELISFAGVKSGMRALDVGCGPGALSVALAERLGAEGVSAVDPSAAFVEACQVRVPGIDVAEASAEALPFANDSFDVALSQLVVNFMDDPESGVGEMARVTRPGGIVASCVWDYAGEMTLLRAFWDAAREIVPERAAGADEGLVMPWCGDGELVELWRAADLGSVHFSSLIVSANYVDFEDLWSPFPTGVGPAGAFCKSLSAEDQLALRTALRRRLKASNDPFALTARAWAVAGTVKGLTEPSQRQP
jgi:SAM-dependent methyltransferase